VAANPLLVVARASNPSQASSLAEPWSQGLGSSSGRPGRCSSRNRLAVAAWSSIVASWSRGSGGTSMRDRDDKRRRPRGRIVRGCRPGPGSWGGTSCSPRQAAASWEGLVGDAGLVMDPITGQGIGDALRDAELLAAAVADGLGSRFDTCQPIGGAPPRAGGGRPAEPRRRRTRGPRQPGRPPGPGRGDLPAAAPGHPRRPPPAGRPAAPDPGAGPAPQRVPDHRGRGL
jgi:hypothetical protein